MCTVDQDMTKDERKRFEELCELKLKVVEERNEIVMQTEEERVRELEEDVTTTNMFDRRFGGSGAAADEESSSEEGKQEFTSDYNNICFEKKLRG